MEKKIMLATFRVKDYRRTTKTAFKSVCTEEEFEKFIKKNEHRIMGNKCKVVFMEDCENDYMFTFDEIRSMEFFR